MTNGTCCGKYFWISGFIVAVYGWLFDWLWHGKLFMDLYVQTAALWRPESEMQHFVPFCIAYHLIIAFLITGGFFCWRKHIIVGAVGSSECPYRKAMGFGLWIGLVLGLSASTMYIFMPIPASLALMWFAGNVVKWTVGGFLLAKLLRVEGEE